MVVMPSRRERATVWSALASSIRITSSTTSNGISRYVCSSVRSALYAGSTTTTRLFPIISADSDLAKGVATHT